MLKKIYVQNYILIDNISITFDNNFSVLTGETGSGKSILLGALGLVIGNRSDISAIKAGEQKCIIEAYFDVDGYELLNFFEENEIDYDTTTIFRREITSAGKSRAFINDTPVNLNIMKELGEKLIDIHSQHQTLSLTNRHFQLEVIDTVAQNGDLRAQYHDSWQRLQQIRNEIAQQQTANDRFREQYEYLTYQYEQLKSAKLVDGELEELEAEQKQLNNMELIISNLTTSTTIANSDEGGIMAVIKYLENLVGEVAQYLPVADDWCSRLESGRIEIQEVIREIERQVELLEFDPQRLEYINSRIGNIYDLLKKHNKQTVNQLIAIQEELANSLASFETSDEQVEKLKQQEKVEYQRVEKLANELSKTRKKVSPDIEQQVGEILRQLGMPNAQFRVEIVETEPNISGKDQIKLLFSSNPQVAPDEVGKIASGGELSRLMLALKATMSRKKNLPTIIFDEIDTGISGEIADKMANIMSYMSENMQVISITHLPQIAAKAHKHYLVYKNTESESTTTNIKMLTQQEQLLEIARMLSGEQLGKAAIENAKELLSQQQTHKKSITK